MKKSLLANGTYENHTTNNKQVNLRVIDSSEPQSTTVLIDVLHALKEKIPISSRSRGILRGLRILGKGHSTAFSKDTHNFSAVINGGTTKERIVGSPTSL